MIIWGGVGNKKTVKLATINMESRSLSRFLEPAVRNSSRGTLKSTSCNFVWPPRTSTSTYAWPLPQDKLWVETNTAFHQDLLMIRSFNLHELGQIIDLCSDWSTALVQIVWKLNDGALPPLRVLAEIGIIGGVWLLSQQSNQKDIGIAASWRRRSPMRARSPVIKRSNYYVAVWADVSAWCPLSLRTDFEVAPSKALAIKTFACTDRAFSDEENFCFSSWRPGLLL
jgi:hypothetical protein